jgi:protein-disulfide isomerase
MSFFTAGHRILRTAQALVIIALLPLSPAYAQTPPAAEDALKATVERLLKEHPEIILEILKENSETVLEIAQQGSILRKRKAALAQWESDATQHKSPDLDGRAFRGSMNAPVTIVAYSDFTCPYCRQAEATMGQLLKKYNGSIRMTFKALPKEDHPFSQAAAKYEIGRAHV